MIPLTHLAVSADFLRQLPRYLRRPMTADAAMATLHKRWSERPAFLMSLIRAAAFDGKATPYRALFDHAGCRYGDVEQLVRDEGVDGALHRLRERGIYLTVDEFKGRQPIRRGSLSVQAEPHAFRNPRASFHVAARSGGSRSEGTPVLFDLDFVRGCGVDFCVFLEARGGSAWIKADWETPGAGARFRLLKMASFGAAPAMWFSQVDPASGGLPPIFRWSERAMRWGSRFAGVPLPRPRYAPLSDPTPIVQWLRATLDAGATPHVNTFTSSAVRAARCAIDANIDLTGAQFLAMGEPITEPRLAAARQSGATVLPRYGSIESGPIAYACLRPDAADDMHLLDDLQALIQVPVDGATSALPAGTLLISSLHPRAPFALLNVSMGDEATISARPCGCRLEHIGWTTHLTHVRSFEKLTAGGVTFLAMDVIRVLEDVLPRRFGGAPTDYQLLEEDVNGLPTLRLVVDPKLGSIDETAIAATLLKELGSGSSINKVMGAVLRDGGAVRVDRSVPRATHSGKILHLHVGRSQGQ